MRHIIHNWQAVMVIEGMEQILARGTGQELIRWKILRTTQIWYQKTEWLISKKLILSPLSRVFHFHSVIQITSYQFNKNYHSSINHFLDIIVSIANNS